MEGRVVTLSHIAKAPRWERDWQSIFEEGNGESVSF